MPRPRTIEQPYCTTDLYQASYLVAAGHRLEGMRADSKRVTFEFLPEAREAADDYPMSTVNTLQYVSVLKSLKSACAARMGGTLP